MPSIVYFHYTSFAALLYTSETNQRLWKVKKGKIFPIDVKKPDLLGSKVVASEKTA